MATNRIDASTQGTDVTPASGRQGSQRDAGATGSDAVPAAGGRQDAGATGSDAVRAARGRQDAGATDGVSVRSRGRLPHWEKKDSIYFVTFRLADALPQSALNAIEFERKDILRTAQQQGRELTTSEQEKLAKLFSESIEKYLDAGHGACHLARPEIAALVAAALRNFDRTRYRLIAWCVMPNHVHVVFQPSAGHQLAGILHSWKSFTAKKANKVLKRTGEFWQREYYDHLVRDERDFHRIVRYVIENPARAGLQGWKWVWLAT